MAKYQLTGPDGAKYEVTAPDEASQEEVLARFQKEVGQAKPADPKQAYQRDVDQEAARRQKAGGLDAVSGTQATIGDTLSLGAFPQITAAGRVGFDYLRGKSQDFSEDYGRERDVIRSQIRQKRAEMGTAETLPLDILGGMAAAPAAGAEAVAQIPNAISYGRQLWNAAKVGGGLGAVHGFNEETGDYGDKIVHGIEGGVGGAIATPLLKGGIDLGVGTVRGVRNALAARRTGRADKANATAEDFAATGTPEFTPALGGPITEGTASGLAGTVLGGPIRAQARTSLDALEANIRRQIEASGGTGTPAEVGERAKQFLNRQLVQESIPSAEVEGMNALQLHDISGVPPAPGVNVPPPRVPRVEPRDVGRVRPEDVVEEAVAGTPAIPPKPVTDLESRYKPPTPEEIELAPEMVKRVQKASADVADMGRRVQAEQDSVAAIEKALTNEMGTVGFVEAIPRGHSLYLMKAGDKPGSTRIGAIVDREGRFLNSSPLSPEEKAVAEKVMVWIRDHRPDASKSIEQSRAKLEQAKREQDIVQREMEAFRIQELPRLAEQRRAEALADATKANEAEASVATQKAKEGARAKASADAVQEAMRRTEANQAAEVDRAAQETVRRQAAANQAHQEDLAAAQARIGEPLNIGANRLHTYPTEFAAAYRQNERNAPQVRMNPLGARPPVYKAPPQPQRGARYTPAEVDDAIAAWEATRDAPGMPETLTQFIIRQGGIKDTGAEARHVMGGAKARPGLINNKSGRPLDDLGEAAQQAGFFHERPTVAELLDHLDNDLNRGAPVVRLQDQEALMALREHADVRTELERVGIAGAKSADEARKIMSSQLGPRPPVRRETMTPLRPADEIHATADILDRFAAEAPMGRLKYKAGNLFEDGGAVWPEVMNYLESHLGKRVTDQIAHLSDLRSSPGQAFAPGIDKLFKLRTDIGQEIRAIRDSRRSGYSGSPRSENDAMLSRLYDALDTDIKSMMRAGGPQGAVAAAQREQIDAAYKDYVNNIRAPLAKIFPEQADPLAAFHELVSATQANSKKINTLEAFYRVVDNKGDRLQATSWLLNDMTRDGIPGFLKAYRNLSPDARRIMDQGEARPLFEFLDRAARVGGKLERFVKTAGEDGGLDLTKATRTGNLAIGSVAYLFGIPGAIAEVVGGAGLSKVLASKWYAGWLKSYPVTRDPASPELMHHMNRLYALASESLGLNRDAAQDLKAALTPGKASAAMVGERAQGVDHISLKAAKKMEKGKVDRADIWLQTGWTKDPDGKWRSEISDADSKLTDEGKDAIKRVYERKDKELTLPMSAVVHHPELFKAYPQLKDYTIRFFQRDPWTARNWGGAEDQGININVDTHHAAPSLIMTTIRHELQHNIQDEEGMARGGVYGSETTREEYLRRSREAQARMTEKRQFMSDEERRARPPWLDYQVPENEIEWKPRKPASTAEMR